MSQGDVDYVCLLPKVASFTGSLGCSSEFYSPTPACLLGVSYGEPQTSFKAIIQTGNLDGWEAQSQIHSCTMAGHNIDATVLLERALSGIRWAGKSETSLLIQLQKLWPLDQMNSALYFSGMVFVHHLWETEPLVTGLALG